MRKTCRRPDSISKASKGDGRTESGGRWLYFIILLATILLTFITCRPAFKNHGYIQTLEPGPTPAHILSQYRLVWNDEFGGPAIDPLKWNYRAEGTFRVLATVSRDTISLDGQGHLVISVIKDDEGKYYVGQLGTEGLFETKFGYFECRAKMNSQVGPHVAFWLQSPDMSKGGDAAENGAEIDIFEYHRRTPGIIYHTVHWGGYGEGHKQEGVEIPVSSIDTGFHTFGLEWTPAEYIFYVDGRETWRTATAVSRRPQYIILSTELTGWGGDPSQSIFPDAVIFDYVRVYERPGKEALHIKY